MANQVEIVVYPEGGKPQQITIPMMSSKPMQKMTNPSATELREKSASRRHIVADIAFDDTVSANGSVEDAWEELYRDLEKTLMKYPPDIWQRFKIFNVCIPAEATKEQMERLCLFTDQIKAHGVEVNFKVTPYQPKK